MQGRVDAGLSEIRESLAGQLAAGSVLVRPALLAFLADACLHAGRLDEALAATAEGLECAAATGDRHFRPDLERLRGEALHRADGNEAEIDACFQRAMDEARAFEAKSLELRAATSAARVWVSRGERSLARDTLTPVYAWFTEGFDTQDLIAARSLLDALG
jgi:predicted ATPase